MMRRILLWLVGGEGYYYSDYDECDCGWAIPGNVWAVSVLKLVKLQCPECGEYHDYILDA